MDQRVDRTLGRCPHRNLVLREAGKEGIGVAGVAGPHPSEHFLQRMEKVGWGH